MGLLGNALRLVVDGDIGVIGYQVVQDGSELTSLFGEHTGLAIKHLTIVVDAIEVRLDALIACIEIILESGEYGLQTDPNGDEVPIEWVDIEIHIIYEDPIGRLRFRYPFLQLMD